MKNILDNLKNDHHDFDLKKTEEEFREDPLELFGQWFENAVNSNQPEANAFSLSTVDSSGQSSSRIVYLKELVDNEFVFYTNYQSSKGKNLALNPKAAMLFFWAGLQQQIRIEGTCSKIDAAISDAYFNSRPRASQIGAWASSQSERLESRAELENRFEALTKKYPNEVPRPPHWGGYSLRPSKIEFWQGRPSRLHDRIVFEKTNTHWSVYRLYP